MQIPFHFIFFPEYFDSASLILGEITLLKVSSILLNVALASFSDFRLGGFLLQDSKSNQQEE